MVRPSGRLSKLIQQEPVEFVVAVQVCRDVSVFNSSHNFTGAFIMNHHIQLFLDAVKRERQG